MDRQSRPITTLTTAVVKLSVTVTVLEGYRCSVDKKPCDSTAPTLIILVIDAAPLGLPIDPFHVAAFPPPHPL